MYTSASSPMNTSLEEVEILSVVVKFISIPRSFAVSVLLLIVSLTPSSNFKGQSRVALAKPLPKEVPTAVLEPNSISASEYIN